MLVAILRDRDLKLFRLLNENVFIDYEKEQYKIIKEYVEKYRSLPSIQTFAELIDEEEILVPDAPIDLLYQRCIERKLKEDLLNLSTEIEEDIRKHEIDALISRMERFIARYKRLKQIEDGVKTFRDLAQTVLDYIQEKRTKIDKPIGIPTGWDTLDFLTGGYQPEDLDLIVARPKMGKSLIMAYSALHVAQQGYIPMLISMEMSIKQQAKRIIALHSKLNFSALHTGEISSFAEREIASLLDTELPFLYVEGRFSKTIDDIAFLVEKYNPDIVFIDGGYLIKIQKHYKSLWENATVLANELKNLALTYSKPFVVSFQFNRQASRTKGGDLEKIQLTDALSQLVSVAIGIHGEDNSPTKVIDVFANREGITQSFEINWDWERMDFSEVKNEENQTASRTA